MKKCKEVGQQVKAMKKEMKKNMKIISKLKGRDIDDKMLANIFNFIYAVHKVDDEFLIYVPNSQDYGTSEKPKYSDDVEKRAEEMQKERIFVEVCAENAPIGHLLNMVDIIVKEMLSWEYHEDFSREYILGLIMSRISTERKGK